MNIAKPKKLLIIVLILHSLIVCSQTHEIDSLKKVLNVQKETKKKVNALNELSWAFLVQFNFPEAMNFANQALKLSEKLGYKLGYATANYNIGSVYHTQDNIPKAKENYSIAYKIYQEIGDKKGIANSYLSFGQIYLLTENNIQEARRYLSEAIKIQEEIGDKKGLIYSYLSLGSTHTLQENDPEALECFYKMLMIGEELNDNESIAAALGKIGMVYSDNGLNDKEGFKVLTRAINLNKGIGAKLDVAFNSLCLADILKRQKKYTEALNHQLSALQIYRDTPNFADVWSMAYCLERIGGSYELQGDSAYSNLNKIYAFNLFSQAERNYAEAYEIRKKNNNIGVYALQLLGGIQIKLGRYIAARQTLEKSLAESKSYNFKSNLNAVYRHLSTLDSLEGNYKGAYHNYRNHILYRDSLNNKEINERVTQTRMQYEFDKKEDAAKVKQEKKDEEAKRTRNLQYSAIAAILLIAFFLLVINRQKQKAKSKVEKAYSELKSTQAQLIQSEKMASLGELTAGIAHEIQNPLNFVNNFSEINTELIYEAGNEMNKGNIFDAKIILNEIKENEQKISHHGKRADAIVKGMLQHSRSSSGKKEPTDINALAEEYLRLAYHGLRAKNKSFNATLKTDFDKSIMNINIVHQDIGRVILNLINNAFYACTERSRSMVNEKKPLRQAQGDTYEPTVSVSTKKEGNNVFISVTDNGNGIPQKIFDKIFQPFFTTKPTGQGTGLGLSMSYDIIKAHGGELKVESKDGEGSEFIIQLPVV